MAFTRAACGASGRSFTTEEKFRFRNYNVRRRCLFLPSAARQILRTGCAVARLSLAEKAMPEKIYGQSEGKEVRKVRTAACLRPA